MHADRAERVLGHCCRGFSVLHAKPALGKGSSHAIGSSISTDWALNCHGGGDLSREKDGSDKRFAGC